MLCKIAYKVNKTMVKIGHAESSSTLSHIGKIDLRAGAQYSAHSTTLALAT